MTDQPHPPLNPEPKEWLIPIPYSSALVIVRIDDPNANDADGRAALELALLERDLNGSPTATIGESNTGTSSSITTHSSVSVFRGTSRSRMQP